MQIFGYPISEPFDEQNPPVPAGDGQTHRVQYFERYRLEYHPENPDPYKVLLGLLGVSQADKDNLDPALRAPEPAGQPQPDCIGQGPCGDPVAVSRCRGVTRVSMSATAAAATDSMWTLSASMRQARTRCSASSPSAQFGWIRQQVRWSSYEPAKGQFGNNYVAQVDALINAAAAKGVNIMLSPVSSPDWAGAGGGLPKNPQDFADFIGFMANRYKGKVAGVRGLERAELRGRDGRAQSMSAPISRSSRRGIRRSRRATRISPSSSVGMTPTGVTGHPEVALDDVQYLQQIYAINGGEVKNYYDVLGAHPGSNCNPPDNSYPGQPADERLRHRPGRRAQFHEGQLVLLQAHPATAGCDGAERRKRQEDVADRVRLGQ